MIFLTTGTYPLPFDRLVKAIDDMVGNGMIGDEIFAQIGSCTYTPKYIESVKLLEKKDFDAKFASANALIGHAGMGTITMSLDYKIPLLVMPRLKQYGEMVNDHQVGNAKKFEKLGHILAAFDEKELQEKMPQLKSFVAKPRESQPEKVAERISEFIEMLYRS